jgi:4-hydroxybenzoyl-CoA thioesterase
MSLDEPAGRALGRSRAGPHPRGGSTGAPVGRGAFIRERAIRFSDCDPAGIVFYPQYFVMFNGLLEDWITEGLGIGFTRLLMERRIGLPTVRLEADFTGISRLGDRVALALAVERLGSRSIALALACTAADGAPRMAVRQVIVTTSLETHRAIEIPADLRAAIEQHHPNPDSST